MLSRHTGRKTVSMYLKDVTTHHVIKFLEFILVAFIRNVIENQILIQFVHNNVFIAFKI